MVVSESESQMVMDAFDIYLAPDSTIDNWNLSVVKAISTQSIPVYSWELPPTHDETVVQETPSQMSGLDTPPKQWMVDLDAAKPAPSVGIMWSDEIEMSDDKDVKLSLKVMIDRERNKVLYAVADNHFANILLSFLTLPLGRIVKVLKKHYGKEAPNIGSLSSLYHSLANLDAAYFVTEGAKEALLNPISIFEDESKRQKLDISDSQPAEYFFCNYLPTDCQNRFRSVSMYYDKALCRNCRFYDLYKREHREMRKELAKKMSEASSGGGALTTHKVFFTISDDLQIFPHEMGLLRIITILNITDACKAEEIQVAFGFSEIMNLLKASLTSPTPLSDVILNKTTQMKYSAMVESQPKIVKEENPNPRDLSLKLVIQKSTGKLLYAQAKEDFVEFLFSLLIIPLGGVEHLMSGMSCCKAIDNLYRSTTELLDEYFKSADTKNRLTNPNLPHGYISKNHIFPLAEESLPAVYNDNLLLFSSLKFPKGQGSYLLGPRTYEVKDDLTVTPFCTVSILSSLNNLKIPLSDVKEVELQIGLREALSILGASVTSTSALTDALLIHMSNKQPKTEL